MTKVEQIDRLITMLEARRPAACFEHFDKTTTGIGAVLRLLSNTEGAMTAGEIAANIQFSMPRATALLKKMEARGLIVREAAAADARVKPVRLSEKGRETAQVCRAEMQRQLGAVMDVVGYERLVEFLSLADEILAVLRTLSCEGLQNTRKA